MSYNIQARGATKDETKAALAAAFDKVIEDQPYHMVDKASALASAGSLIDGLNDEPTHDIIVFMNGSVGYVNSAPRSMTCNVTAYLVERATD